MVEGNPIYQPENPEMEAFREEFEMALDTMMFLVVDDDQQPFFQVDPVITGAEREFEDYSPEERAAAKSMIYEKFGVDRTQEDAVVRTYTVRATQEGEQGGAKVPGVLSIDVLRTTVLGTVTRGDGSEEEVPFLLQEITYPNGQQRFVLGQDVNLPDATVKEE